ncbi:MAG TPA: hypothetical protein VKP30_18430 [Polyangiaceae bacterium]|nr:hypothetical protein [Polyangiaceae bacterium]
MRETLSSANTFFYKVVFPVLWIGGFTIGTAMLFLTGVDARQDARLTPPPDMKWMFLVATLVGSAFIYWGCVRLKRVALDGHRLYISNYLKEVVVPLQELECVSENRLVNIHPVTLSFRSETEFGRRVVFMPRVRLFAFLSSLRTAAAQVGRNCS